jgi:hypothetical protein
LDTEGLVEKPHAYLRIWLGCRRYGNALNGAPCLPGPGSYLEQDAELMLAFDIMSDYWATLREADKIREITQKAAQQAHLNQ